MTEPRLLRGDCVEVLRGLAENSVDAVVTDPPYGLAFMGKKWDYSVPGVEVWRECLRVLKPGGYLLAFAGTRTQHRMCVNIEDAGFHIRDLIAWVYGSGFPKSHDVSKAIDRKRHDREQLYIVTNWIREMRDAAGLTNQKIDDAFGFHGMAGHWTSNKSQPAIPTIEQIPLLLDVLGVKLDDVPEEIRRLIWTLNSRKGQPGAAWFDREILGKSTNSITGGTGKHGGIDHCYGYKKSFDITAPATEAAKQWEGWGTALKPALEPITVARKPFAGTIAENVLTWGTGAINVDGCRIEAPDAPEGCSRHGGGIEGNGSSFELPDCKSYMPAGRWPANLIHDGSNEVNDHFPDDSARFFYCPKADKADRDAGLSRAETSAADKTNRKPGSAGINPYAGTRVPSRNNHPTVKPVALMQYLCRLVTQPGGVVLDPFMGSGTTGRACLAEGFGFVGIERDPDYFDLASERMRRVQLPLFGGA